MTRWTRWIAVLAAVLAVSAGPARADEAPHSTFRGPDGSPLPFSGADDAIEFLRTAEVVSAERAKGGISGARKLLLERDGVRAHAVFRCQAVTKLKVDLPGGFEMYFRDHHANEVAAYRLARALGLDTVPPTVARRLWNREGSLQLWIEGAETEKGFRERELSPVEQLKHRMQVDLMAVFDALIRNVDRNLGNYITDSSGAVWWIDHTRSFSRVPRLPRGCHLRRIDQGFWQRLQALPDEQIAEALAAYLDGPEIEGVLERRRLIVDLLRDRLEEKDSGSVLFSMAYARPAH